MPLIKAGNFCLGNRRHEKEGTAILLIEIPSRFEVRVSHVDVRAFRFHKKTHQSQYIYIYFFFLPSDCLLLSNTGTIEVS